MRAASAGGDPRSRVRRARSRDACSSRRAATSGRWIFSASRTTFAAYAAASRHAYRLAERFAALDSSLEDEGSSRQNIVTLRPFCGGRGTAVPGIRVGAPRTRGASEPSQCESESSSTNSTRTRSGRPSSQKPARKSRSTARCRSRANRNRPHLRIASSEAALAHPDIDSGTGTPGQGTSATRYTFTSTRATARREPPTGMPPSHTSSRTAATKRGHSTRARSARQRERWSWSPRPKSPSPPGRKPRLTGPHSHRFDRGQEHVVVGRQPDRAAGRHHLLDAHPHRPPGDRLPRRLHRGVRR